MLEMEGGNLHDLIKQVESLANPEKILSPAIKKIGRLTLRGVIKNTPVKTGYLKRFWKANVKSEGKTHAVTIFNVVDYASYVEYGHRKKGKQGWVEGRHMMAKTVVEVKEKIPSIINAEIKKSMPLWEDEK